MFCDILAYNLFADFRRERELQQTLLAKCHVASNEGPRIELEKQVLWRTGFPLSVFRQLSPEKIIEVIKAKAGAYAPYSSLLLADLLLADAHISQAVGDMRCSTGSQLQAFCLIGDALLLVTPDIQPEYRAKLESLDAKMKALSDSPYLTQTLDKFRAQATQASTQRG